MFSKTIDRNTFILEPDTARGCLADVLSQVEDLSGSYPNFEAWIDSKVLPGLYRGDRSLLVEYRRGVLAGFAILKDDGSEQKLCCLRVLPEFQNFHGLGVRLFERSFQELGTERPLLTIAEERLPNFKKLFDYFNFDLVESYEGIYRPNYIEHSFNGTLDQTNKYFIPKVVGLKNLVCLVS